MGAMPLTAVGASTAAALPVAETIEGVGAGAAAAVTVSEGRAAGTTSARGAGASSTRLSGGWESFPAQSARPATSASAKPPMPRMTRGLTQRAL